MSDAFHTPASVDPRLLEVLVCPVTRGRLTYDRERQELVSKGAKLAFPIRVGEDIGSETVLDRYARWRRFDNAALAAGFDGFVRLFSNDIAPVRLARDLGIAAVNRIAPLRRAFMHEAGGATGDLPRLLRGEAL